MPNTVTRLGQYL